MHNVYLTPRPSLSRVWVPVAIRGRKQLICKWTTAHGPQAHRPNLVESTLGSAEPPALAA
jgi:hypothetical protein